MPLAQRCRPFVRPNKLSVAVALAGSLTLSHSAFAQLEEVIVTAQKRLESAQDVPIAVTAFDAGREKAVNRILRLDPLGLRNLLPRAVIEAAFAKLAVLVRRQARDESGADKIVPEDFFVSADNIDEALDLVALCRP